MTTATGVLAEFAAALDDEVRPYLRLTKTVEYHLEVAMRSGWSVAQLAAECQRRLAPDIDVHAHIVRTLSVAATVPPADHKPATRRLGLAVVPLCGRCEHGWLYDDTDGSAQRCPCRTTEDER